MIPSRGRITGLIIGSIILVSIFLLPFTFRGARPMTLYEVTQSSIYFIDDIQRMSPQLAALNYLFILVFILLIIAGLIGVFPLVSGTISVVSMTLLSVAMYVDGYQLVWGIGYYLSWAASVTILLNSFEGKRRTNLTH